MPENVRHIFSVSSHDAEQSTRHSMSHVALKAALHVCVSMRTDCAECCCCFSIATGDKSTSWQDDARPFRVSPC